MLSWPERKNRQVYVNPKYKPIMENKYRSQAVK